MKRTIRLTESDLHNMVRTAINEVLDNMDDTEKAYWLMQQREQRPNTKSKNPVNYRQQFAQKFNNEVYPEGNSQVGTNWPEYNEGGKFRATNPNGSYAYGGAGVDDNGNFRAWQNGFTAPSQGKPWGDAIEGANFNYYQGRPQNGTNGFSQSIGTGNRGQMQPKDVNMHPQFQQMANKGRTRYNQIQQKYNQQRQSQQPQG